MHQRYEAASAEFNVIDETRSALCPPYSEAAEIHRRELDDACSALISETDGLRTALLLQVPHDAADAAILQFHIVAAYDMLLSYEIIPKHEQEALETAINTMHDYACRMARNAGQVDGDAFAYSEASARRKRRFRTRQVGEDQRWALIEHDAIKGACCLNGALHGRSGAVVRSADRSACRQRQRGSAPGHAAALRWQSVGLQGIVTATG